MSDYETVPSLTLPDYLKVSLRVGEPDQFALVSAIDELGAALGHLAFQRVFDLVAATSGFDRRRAELEAAGFRVDQLNIAQREALFAARGEIWAARGQLGAVAILAEIYFPGATVDLGLPYARSRSNGSAKVHLADRRDRRRNVFVRLPVEVPAALCEEFLSNAEKQLPAPFSAVLAFPKKAKQPATRWSLSAPRQWEKRRVECLISRK